MSKFEPWVSCPEIGPYHRYMGRMSNTNATSLKEMAWPASGYVECDNWGGDIFDPDSPKGNNPGGLWGYLNCVGDWRDPIALGYENGIVQILVIDTREACFDVTDPCRTPRAWVKYSGSPLDIYYALIFENTFYAFHCARRMIHGIINAQQDFLRYLSGRGTSTANFPMLDPIFPDATAERLFWSTDDEIQVFMKEAIENRAR